MIQGKRNERDHDIKLLDKLSSPATTLELALQDDPNTGLPRWTEGRAPFLPPRLSTDRVRYEHRDPRVDYVFAQDDYSGGALEPVWFSAPVSQTGQHNRYSYAYGVDARAKGAVMLGYHRSNNQREGFLLRNGSFEESTSTPVGWNLMSGCTASIITGTANTVSADPNSSAYVRKACRVTTPGNLAAGSIVLQQALNNPTVYRSNAITVYAWVKGYSATHGLALLIVDDTGSSTSAVTATGSYVLLKATRTINAGTTAVTIKFQLDPSGGAESVAEQYDIDDLYVIPDSDPPSATACKCAGLATLGSSAYGAFGKAVCQYNATNHQWDLVYYAATQATGIVEFAGNVVVAFGSSTAYIYGSGTSWTASTRTGNDKYAIYLTTSRGGSGASMNIWKSETANTVKTTSDPTGTAAAWSSAYTVGSTDKPITNMTSYQDSLVVGKTDGLWMYLRNYRDGSAADQFENIALEFGEMSDTENFAVMAPWRGWLYVSTARQGFFRYDGTTYGDLSTLLVAPRLTDFGGRVRAMAGDTANLWLCVDTPVADATSTKDVWLASLQVFGGWGEGRQQISFYFAHPVVHTLDKIRMGIIDAAAVVTTASNTDALIVCGRTYITGTGGSPYVSSIYMIDLPTKTVAPATDPSQVFATAGILRTSTWDGDLPDVNKALIGLTLYTGNLSGNTRYIDASWVGDDGVKTLLGRFNTSPVQTLYFTGGAPITDSIEKQLALEFSLVSTDGLTDGNSGSSPILYSHVLHTALHNPRLKTYEFYVRIGNSKDLQGKEELVAKADQLSRISTLEQQVYPFVLQENFNGDGTVVAHYCKLLDLQRLPDEEQVDYDSEIYRLTVQEYVVA